MRLVRRAVGSQQATTGQDQTLQVVRQTVEGKKNPPIVIHRNQSAVEQPVERPGERESIADCVRAIGFDRLNVSRLDLRTAAAIQ